MRTAAYLLNVLAAIWNVVWMVHYAKQGNEGMTLFHAVFLILAGLCVLLLLSTES